MTMKHIIFLLLAALAIPACSQAPDQKMGTSERAQVAPNIFEVASLPIHVVAIDTTDPKHWDFYDMDGLDGEVEAEVRSERFHLESTTKQVGQVSISHGGFVSSMERLYPPSHYLSQEDTAGNINWMLVCPGAHDQNCSVYQRAPAGASLSFINLKFRPGQEVHLKDQRMQAVRIASFDDYRSGATSYPVLIFDRPYYNVQYLGFWQYLSEDVLEE